MDEMKAILTEIMENVTITNAKLDALTSEVNCIKIDVAVLKKDVAQLKVDVAELKQDVAQLKVEVAQLKTDMVEVKTELSSFRMETRRSFIGYDRKFRAVEAELDHSAERFERLEKNA